MSEEQGFYAAGQSMDIARTVAEKTIAYRPSLKSVAKSTNGAIILQQIAGIGTATKNGLFISFCNHVTMWIIEMVTHGLRN